MEPWTAPQRALRTVDELMDILYSGQGARCAPEPADAPVDLHEHALQTAALLRRARPSDKELQVAGLLQDIGLLLHPDAAGPAARTEGVADTVHRLLGARVAHLVRLHAPAERYLAAREPGRALSPWSTRIAGPWSGAMPAAEADAFVRDPLAEDAVALRQAAEAAHVVGLDAGILEDWRPVLELVAANHAAPPPEPPPGPPPGRAPRPAPGHTVDPAPRTTPFCRTSPL